MLGKPSPYRGRRMYSTHTPTTSRTPPGTVRGQCRAPPERRWVVRLGHTDGPTWQASVVLNTARWWQSPSSQGRDALSVPN